MKPFFTITSKDTQFTNSRSHRFASEEEAIVGARARIARGEATGVYVLRSVALVERTDPPVHVTHITDKEAE